MRVWVWHNGTDEETLEIVQSFRDHPSFFKFHHSIENKKLNEPTNWLWTHAKGDFLSKVDDDCQMRHGILGLQFALPGLVGSDLNGIPKEGATLAEKLNLSVNIIGRSVIKTAQTRTLSRISNWQDLRLKSNIGF
jgi:glycosyltransferase involved in cell wall biosynthesis